MNTFNIGKTAQSGRSMIEMLGVLAIVGILSAGGIAGYSMAMEQYKSNLLIEKVQLIVSRARTIYKNGDYTGISNQNLIDSGKLSGKDLENPFGGNLSVTRKMFATTGYLGIGIQNDISMGACMDIFTTEWGNSILNIVIGTNGSGSVYSTFPYNPSSAKQNCASLNGKELWLRFK